MSDYSHSVDENGVPMRYRYSYDMVMSKKKSGLELNQSDEFVVRDYKEMMNNGDGLNNTQLRNKNRIIEDESIRVSEKRKIDAICDAIQFFAPFMSYGILKTGVNAVRKINK